MDKLQDVLTLAATVTEGVFLASLAVAFVSYALKSPRTVKQPRVAPVPDQAWKRAVDSKPSASLVPIAG